MKNLVLIAFILPLLGCATKGRYTDSELNNCDIGAFNQNENSEFFKVCVKNYRRMMADYNESQKRQSDPTLIAEQERKATKERNLKESVRQIGAKMSDYINAYGSPDNTEIINGEQVLWFNDSQAPEFVSFKNGLLTSIVLDRETINLRNKKRQENSAAEARRIEQSRIESQQRAAAFGKSLNDSQKTLDKYFSPKQPASTTKCKQDPYSNNITCETYEGN